MSILDLLLGQRQNSTVQNNTPGINPAAPNPFEILDGGREGGLLNNRLLLNLMAGSGFSTMPDSPFGAFGRAALATKQQEQEERQLGIREKMIASRLGAGTQAPSAVREFEFFQSLGDPEKPDEITPAQRSYLAVKRAQQVRDVAGVGLTSVQPDGLEVLAPESTIQTGLGDRARSTEGGKQDAITAAIPDQVMARSEAEAAALAARELPELSDKLTTVTGQANEFIRQLESGQLDTGFFRGMFPALSTEEQLFDVFSGEQVLGRISEATFGALSEGEREFIRNTVISRQKTPEANIKLLREIIATIEKAEKRAREAAGQETQAPNRSSAQDRIDSL